MTSPAAVLIVKLLQDALDTQPTIISQPNEDDLLALNEKFLDVLQTISCDRVGGFHHVVRFIQSETANMSDHGGIPHFPSQRGISVGVHPPYVHPQHLKVLKHFAYICHGWGMQFLGVWGLNYDHTISFGLGHAPIFQKSTASQGAKALCISNMDVGCSQWGFTASNIILQHHTGSAIPHFS